jgi:hypothetical protein
MGFRHGGGNPSELWCRFPHLRFGFARSRVPAHRPGDLELVGRGTLAFARKTAIALIAVADGASLQAL